MKNQIKRHVSIYFIIALSASLAKADAPNKQLPVQCLSTLQSLDRESGRWINEGEGPSFHLDGPAYDYYHWESKNGFTLLVASMYSPGDGVRPTISYGWMELFTDKKTEPGSGVPLAASDAVGSFLGDGLEARLRYWDPERKRTLLFAAHCELK